NFLIERSGKMSKSAGEFLRVQLLIDKGFHPLAYRLMCLQAHYRSELEFSWDGLVAAFTRLKRMVMAVSPLKGTETASEVTDKRLIDLFAKFDAAVSDDLNTAIALTALEETLSLKKIDQGQKLLAIAQMDAVLGLELLHIERADLRVRPKNAVVTEPEIEAILAERREARANKDFAASDRIRDALTAKGVDVMDGDPLGWDWKLEI
ncbi:MAG: cysteine--tRNA ligase, partial [Pseudomonadota bacterium]